MNSVAIPGRRQRRRGRARPLAPDLRSGRRPVSRARARASGRAASLSSYVAVGIVGALLCGIVTLQIGALRANIAAGTLDQQRRAIQAESINQRAALVKRFPRATVEQEAIAMGMVLPAADAFRQLKVAAR